MYGAVRCSSQVAIYILILPLGFSPLLISFLHLDVPAPAATQKRSEVVAHEAAQQVHISRDDPSSQLAPPQGRLSPTRSCRLLCAVLAMEQRHTLISLFLSPAMTC